MKLWPKLPDYDPALSEDENDVRMFRAMDEMKKAKRAAKRSQHQVIMDDETQSRSIRNTKSSRRWLNDAYENYEG